MNDRKKERKNGTSRATYSLSAYIPLRMCAVSVA